MKLTIGFLLLTACFTCIAAEHDVEDLVAHGDKCGGTKEDLASLALYKLSDTHTSKCMYACMSKNYGIRNQQGVYSKEQTKHFYKTKWTEFDSHASDIAEKCDKEMKKYSPEHDECEYGYQVVKCLRDYMDEHGYFTPYVEKSKRLHEKIVSGVFKVAEDFKLKLKDELEKFKSISIL